MTNPDNIPDGYGHAGTDQAIFMILFFIFLLVAVIEGIYIIYLLINKSRLEEKLEIQSKAINEENKQQ